MRLEKNSIPCIEPMVRCVQVPDALGAGLITGTDKIRNGFGNGDGILLDFRHRVFAVADASERFPGSSRRLLQRLYDVLETNGTPRDAVDFRQCIQGAWREQKYNHKTTLSCIALERRKNVAICHVFNGGDSQVLVVDAVDGTVIFHTAADMNFAGRTRQLPGVTSLGITDDRYRILLVSDGFQDILKKLGSENGMVPVSLVADPVHRIGERIRNVLENAQPPIDHDDIAVVLIHPGRMRERDVSTVIVGGTTPGEEAAYREYTRRGTPEPVPAKDWKHHKETWHRVGIRTCFAVGKGD